MPARLQQKLQDNLKDVGVLWPNGAVLVLQEANNDRNVDAASQISIGMGDPIRGRSSIMGAS